MDRRQWRQTLLVFARGFVLPVSLKSTGPTLSDFSRHLLDLRRIGTADHRPTMRKVRAASGRDRNGIAAIMQDVANLAGAGIFNKLAPGKSIIFHGLKT